VLHNAKQFMSAMGDHFGPLGGMDEMLFVAMEHVRHYPETGQFFGAVADGTFYMDNRRSIFWEDTTPVEALGILRAMKGDRCVASLEPY
jgi:hypothetical protein